MSPGEHLPADEKENQSNPAKGGASLRAPQEILSTRDPVSGGNAADLISTQPLPASQGASGPRKPRSDPQKPTCPRCGLAVPDQRLHPIPPSLSRLQGSGLSAKCSGSRKRDGSKGSEASSHQPAATPSDSCFHLLLACLSCQCSVLLLGLLEACSSCLHGLCSSCCHACARCCSAVQEAPVEEFNCHAHCHSYLFESCCEPTECLEFCLECCELCHRS